MSKGYQPGKAPIMDEEDGRAYVIASVTPAQEEEAEEYFNQLIGPEGGFPLLLAVGMAVMHFNSPADEGTFRDKRVQPWLRRREDVQKEQ